MASTTFESETLKVCIPFERPTSASIESRFGWKLNTTDYVLFYTTYAKLPNGLGSAFFEGVLGALRKRLVPEFRETFYIDLWKVQLAQDFSASLDIFGLFHGAVTRKPSKAASRRLRACAVHVS